MFGVPMQLTESQLQNWKEHTMKEKAKANPTGIMPRHKAMAMGEKIETGAKKAPKKR